MEFAIETETAMETFGARLVEAAIGDEAGGGGRVIYLQGELGTGKTTLVRGLLRRLGHFGAVKSPTYTLVEAYDLRGQRIYHFDLYRLAEAEELEYLGVRDYFLPNSIWLVEWPERGAGRLPPPDLRIELSYMGAGRRVRLSAATSVGKDIIAVLRLE